MFKTKWQKKYEEAMKTIEFWVQFHDQQIKNINDGPYWIDIHAAQKTALLDTLADMKRIAES